MLPVTLHATPDSPDLPSVTKGFTGFWSLNGDRTLTPCGHTSVAERHQWAPVACLPIPSTYVTGKCSAPPGHASPSTDNIAHRAFVLKTAVLRSLSPWTARSAVPSSGDSCYPTKSPRDTPGSPGRRFTSL